MHTISINKTMKFYVVKGLRYFPPSIRKNERVCDTKKNYYDPTVIAFVNMSVGFSFLGT